MSHFVIKNFAGPTTFASVHWSIWKTSSAQSCNVTVSQLEILLH
ncbi:MAG: hypothetical protein WCG25_08715 [bacterium]